jgi:hypothetical protein
VNLPSRESGPRYFGYLGTEGTFPVILDSCGEKYEKTFRLSPYFHISAPIFPESRGRE